MGDVTEFAGAPSSQLRGSVRNLAGNGSICVVDANDVCHVSEPKWMRPCEQDRAAKIMVAPVVRQIDSSLRSGRDPHE